MYDWYKHREAKDYYDINFADVLSTGETIVSGTATVSRKTGMVLQDLTAIVFRSTVDLQGTYVRLLLSEARDAVEQPAGAYVVECVVTTSDARILVANVNMLVHEGI